jgi:hypothetical protein
MHRKNEEMPQSSIDGSERRIVRCSSSGSDECYELADKIFVEWPIFPIERMLWRIRSRFSVAWDGCFFKRCMRASL